MRLDRFALVASALLFTLIPTTALAQASTPFAAPAQSRSTPPISNQPIPTIRVTSRLVVLDVIVTDSNGNPVNGLKPSDFMLFEDGFQQALSGFTEHDTSSNTLIAPAPPLPPNTFSVQPPPPESVTKTIIVLDMLHYPDYPLVLADIQAFMKSAPSGNPICIIRADWHGLHMVQDFTSDPQLLRRAVASQRMLPPLPNPDPLHIPVLTEYARLVRYLDGIPGRINLAWITDAGEPSFFIRDEYPAITTLVSNLQQPTTVLRLGRITLYAIKAGGYIGGILQPYPTPDIPIPAIPGMIGGVPRDPELMPAAQGSLLANQDLVNRVTEFGGHAFFDGAAKALNQILAMGSNYYTLAYVPTNTDWNGAYRNVAINVSGGPEAGKSAFGWTAYEQPQVTYRHGYYALSTPSPLSGSPAFGPDNSTPLAVTVRPNAPPVATFAPRRSLNPVPPIDAAMGFGTIPPNQINFSITVTSSEGKEKPKFGVPPAQNNFLDPSYRDATYRNVQVHYRVDPKDLKFSRTPDGSYRDDLLFVAILYGDNGFAVNPISTKAHIQFPVSRFQEIMSSGIVFDQTIAIPVKPTAASGRFYATPDNFFLRIGVNETSTNHIGAIEIPVDSIKLSSPTAASQ